MKNYRLLSLLSGIVLLGIIFGCSEKQKEIIPPVVTLSADKTTIKANGKDSLRFIVKVDDKETIAGVTIAPADTNTLVKPNKLNFATVRNGDYIFYAVYDGQKSNEITVTATKVIITLTADKTTLKSNGTDSVKFTVKADDEEVTSSAVINIKGENETTLQGHTFSTDKSGTYTFYATYEGKQSEELTVRSSTENVTLLIDKSSIKANGKETATFTVKADGKDVTDKAVIMQKGSPDKAYQETTFKTMETDTYKFYAIYDEVKSKEVILQTEYVPFKFIKQHCIMQFASTTCVACPIMTNAINEVTKKYPAIPIVFHLEKHCMNYPEMYGILGETTEFLNPIKKPASSLVDLHLTVKTYPTTTSAKLISSIHTMNSLCPAQTGIALQSKVTDGVIKFTADILTNKTGHYGFYAFIVEDNILFGQMMGKKNVNLKYIHNNVATYKLSDDNPKTGIDLGELKIGKKISRNFTINTKAFSLKRNVNLKNCRIVAYTVREVDGSYCIDNVTSCPLNGSVNYLYSN